MSFVEAMEKVLNSEFFHNFYIVAGIGLAVIGIVMYAGIKTKGRVLLIDRIFKKKQFDRESLKNLYVIQSLYTFIAGIGLLVLVLSSPLSGVEIFYVLLAIGILDFLYDLFAIKTAIRKDGY